MRMVLATPHRPAPGFNRCNKPYSTAKTAIAPTAPIPFPGAGKDSRETSVPQPERQKKDHDHRANLGKNSNPCRMQSSCAPEVNGATASMVERIQPPRQWQSVSTSLHARQALGGNAMLLYLIADGQHPDKMPSSNNDKRGRKTSSKGIHVTDHLRGYVARNLKGDCR